MGFAKDREKLSVQVERLRVASLLFGVPCSEFGNLVGEESGLCAGAPHAEGQVGQMGYSLEHDGLQALTVDFSRLFIGTPQMAAPPYASLYLENRDQVEGEVTRRIAHIYEECGLSLKNAEKLPEDHIAYLLEFLYYLGYRALSDDSDAWQLESAVGEMDAFADEYVLSWAPQLFAKMVDSARTGFYRAFGELGCNGYIIP